MAPASVSSCGTLGVAAVLVPLVGCGLRQSPSTRYQGILLNVRQLGAEELQRQEAADPTVGDWVARDIETGCWITAIDQGTCRTCCRTALRCVIDCRPQTSTVTPRQKAT